MKRAIITGATGAVGTGLVKELVANHVEVLVFCREGSKRNQNILKHPLVNLKYYSLDQLFTVVNDTEKTDSALLASGDETKTFTYSDGQITYDVTAMGITETVKLEKQ